MEVGAGKSGGGDIIRAMLDAEVKRGIDAARKTLVGQVADPLGQVRHITAAVMHRRMSSGDIAAESEPGGKPAFFVDQFAKFRWDRILSPRIGGQERAVLYREAVEKMADNPNLPGVFRHMFRGAIVGFTDPRTLDLFLRAVNDLPVRDGEDLGNAFEYLLSTMGTQGAAGQFRTPRHIIDFTVEVVAPKKGERILDPACGTAGFLIAAHKRILRENSSAFNPKTHRHAFAGNSENAVDVVYADGKFKGDNLTVTERRQLADNIHGYDITPEMVRLSLANMILHGIPDPRIHDYDTLTHEEKWGERFNVVVANPPFMTPQGGIRPHGRFSVRSSNSEVLFVDYILQHLTSRGRAGIIVPEGIVANLGRAHESLRKALVRGGLHAVVSLPGGIFNPYSPVKTYILFVDRERARTGDEILIVRVENDGRDLGMRQKPIDKNDLPAAFELLRNWGRGIKSASSPLAHLWVRRDAVIADEECSLKYARYRQTDDKAGAKWPRVNLGDVCELVKDKPDSFLGERRYYATGAITTHERGEGDMVSFETRPSRADILPRKGDVGFAVMKNTAKVVLIDDFYSGAIFSTGFCFLRPSEKVMPEFLFRMVADERFQRNKDEVAGDGIMGGVRKRDAVKLKIPLPPLETQREIVSAIGAEQQEVDSRQELIAAHEGNIRALVAKVWEAKSSRSGGASKPFAEAALLSVVAGRFGGEEFPLGRFRRMKFSYFVRRKAGEEVMGDFLKKAAGPYNPKARYESEGIALKRQYVRECKAGERLGLAAGPNIAEAEKYLAERRREALAWVDKNFRYKKDEELEALATVDFAMFSLSRRGEALSPKSVAAYMRADGEWRKKLRRPNFTPARIKAAMAELHRLFNYAPPGGGV